MAFNFQGPQRGPTPMFRELLQATSAAGDRQVRSAEHLAGVHMALGQSIGEGISGAMQQKRETAQAEEQAKARSEIVSYMGKVKPTEVPWRVADTYEGGKWGQIYDAEGYEATRDRFVQEQGWVGSEEQGFSVFDEVIMDRIQKSLTPEQRADLAEVTARGFEAGFTPPQMAAIYGPTAAGISRDPSDLKADQAKIVGQISKGPAFEAMQKQGAIDAVLQGLATGFTDGRIPTQGGGTSTLSQAAGQEDAMAFNLATQGLPGGIGDFMGFLGTEAPVPQQPVIGAGTKARGLAGLGEIVGGQTAAKDILTDWLNDQGISMSEAAQQEVAGDALQQLTELGMGLERIAQKGTMLSNLFGTDAPPVDTRPISAAMFDTGTVTALEEMARREEVNLAPGQLLRNATFHVDENGRIQVESKSPGMQNDPRLERFEDAIQDISGLKQQIQGTEVTGRGVSGAAGMDAAKAAAYGQFFNQ